MWGFKKTTTLITILAVVAFSECASEFTKFGVIKGSILPHINKSFFASRWVHSGWECAFLCFQQKNTMCSFAEFSSTSGECKLFFWKDVKRVGLLLDADGPAADLYIGPDQKQMYMGSTQKYFAYTFVEGEKYCGKIGGRLANLTDLYTSRDNGWEICKCGWLNDGFSHYLVSVSKGYCNVTNEHDRCTTSTRWGVFCIID